MECLLAWVAAGGVQHADDETDPWGSTAHRHEGKQSQEQAPRRPVGTLCGAHADLEAAPNCRQPTSVAAEPQTQLLWCFTVPGSGAAAVPERINSRAGQQVRA